MPVYALQTSTNCGSRPVALHLTASDYDFGANSVLRKEAPHPGAPDIIADIPTNGSQIKFFDLSIFAVEVLQGTDAENKISFLIIQCLSLCLTFICFEIVEYITVHPRTVHPRTVHPETVHP